MGIKRGEETKVKQETKASMSVEEGENLCDGADGKQAGIVAVVQCVFDQARTKAPKKSLGGGRHGGDGSGSNGLLLLQLLLYLQQEQRD